MSSRVAAGEHNPSKSDSCRGSRQRRRRQRKVRPHCALGERWHAAAEQLRANQKEIRSGQRDLDRDTAALEREEKKIEAEIVKYAKQGNKQVGLLRWLCS